MAVLVVLAVMVVVAGLLVWRARRDGLPGPEVVAGRFATAWGAGDAAALRDLVVDPAALDRLDPLATVAELQPTASHVTLGVVTKAENGTATAAFTMEVQLSEAGSVRWDGSLPLVDGEEGWAVQWGPSALHPRFPEGGAFRATTTWPERAAILGADGQPLTGEVATVVVGAEPRRIEDRAAVAALLAETLGVDPAAFAAALDAPGVQPDHFVPIVEVRRDRYDAVRDVIHPVPGLLFREGTARQSATTGFARHLLGRFGEVTAERLAELGPPYGAGDLVGLDGLEGAFEEQLAGRPQTNVELVDAKGAVVEVVGSPPAVLSRPLPTTLDPSVQAAAEAALAGVAVPAALVAVDGATGGVRAAVSRPIEEDFDRAVAGRYPPGSTFKVVTAYALLAAGLDPATIVDCPGTLVVDGREFGNFEGGAPGPEPFADAFAGSCNTAMIGQAATLPPGALGDAAATFGFGSDYSLGLPTAGASFPAPQGEVEAAASAIGQAAVEASPLHLATVAAAVATGTWRSPVLLVERADEQVTRPLEPAAAERLRTLMRRVVTQGSGTAADVAGLEVIGKSGTAEFGEGDPLPTHAWFIAAVGDLGAAVLLEGGGVGGRDAAPVMARFLEALPSR
ncbi:MAG: penicillin-binding protein [Acidimicrobiia bacterium]|nr:penicillin-binding protein [Acidimicrobiia bacterium]